MKKIICVCDRCGDTFEKPADEPEVIRIVPGQTYTISTRRIYTLKVSSDTAYTFEKELCNRCMEDFFEFWEKFKESDKK